MRARDAAAGLSVIGDAVPGLKNEFALASPADDKTRPSVGIVFERCEVLRINGAGIYVLGNNATRVRSCTIRGASMAGIEALRGARISVVDSVIQRNAGGGVVLHRGARGLLSSCDISGNGGGGNCGIMDSASCELMDCSILDAGAIGIQVCRARAVVTGCRVARSGESGIVVGGHDSRSCRDRTWPGADGDSAYSSLEIADSHVSQSGSCALLVAPHAALHHCYNESYPETVEHSIVARDCVFADQRRALRLEAPAGGRLDNTDLVEPVPSDIAAWRGTKRMPWRCERVIHCGASPRSASAFRYLREPSLRRLIVEFAS